MACITIKANGKLRDAILDHYNGDVNKTNIIVNDILLGNVLGDTNFHKYLDSKSDIDTYDDGEPTLSEFTEWVGYLEDQNKINKKFSTVNFDTTTKEFLDLSEGFTVELMSTLFGIKGFTPNDLFEQGALIKINEKNILNKTLAKVKNDIRDYAEESDRKDSLLNALDTYPENFYKAYKNYLATTFQVNLEIDTILSDAIENKDSNETRDSAFNKSSFEFDQKASAPNAIKIMIAGLADVQSNGEFTPNDLGLVPAVNFDKTFNFIQQALVELPGDINIVINELSQKTHVVPALTELIKHLNFGSKTYTPSSKKESYAKEQLLRTQFVNQFNKSKNEFSLHIKNEDGTISIINANLDKIENVILREWETNLKEIISKNPKALQNTNKKRQSTKEEFLKTLGVEMSNYSDIPTSIVRAIKDFGISDNLGFKSLYTPKKGEGIRSQLRKLATLQAKSSDNVVDFQHFNAEGKAVYGITLNTYLTSLAKDLRYYAGTDQLKVMYPELFESDYNTNSEWLHKILNGEKINVGVFDGFKSLSASSNVKASKDLKAKDLNVQRITGILMEGKFPFLRSADRSTENYFYFEGSNKLIVDGINAMKTFLTNHLEDEMAAMANKGVNIINYEKNNKDFRAFHIIENDVKKSLLEVFNPKIKTIKNKLIKSNTATLRQELSDEMDKGLTKMQAEDSIWENEKVLSFIDVMINQMISAEKSQLEKNGVLETASGEFKHISESVKKYGNVENVISLFAMNSFASAIEQTKVFTGDLAFYKTPADVFKRMSMLNSTKESARTDSEMNSHINSLTHSFSNRDSVTDSTIRTITIEDVVSTAAEFSGAFDTMLKDVFGKDYKRFSKVYNEMEEADGFAYMTYDEYRIASIRFGEWLPADEDLYQSISRGDTSLIPEVMRRATVKKYQYTGKLVGPTDVNAIAVRKFAIMPLVPGAVPAGSVLEELNNNMLDNNVGMAFYTSAAKAGYQTFDNESGKTGAHSLYDSKGKFHLDASYGIDVLDYKYMGNQLKIHNDPKEKITASTQKRKLVESNFYENGELINPELKDLLDTYNDIQSEIVQDAYTEMVEQDTIDALIDQGLQQGYTSNELKGLSFLKDLPLVDALPNKQRLEALIMARLSNKVISNKRKGDSVAQVPDVGFEVNEESAEIANRHNLEFYRKSPDGKRMLPMEIMIALPTELIDYVATIYGEGTLSQEALDAFNDDIAADNAEFEKTGEYSVLDRITTYVGYRVPNQAASSSDAAKVRKFLPPYMGAAVVVPKPIVAKTGSDFDIDKLNLYKPNFEVLYSNKKAIQKDFTRKISKARLISMLASIEVTPKSKSANDLSTAFIDNVLNAEADFSGDVGFYKDAYRDTIAQGGIAESVTYNEGDKKNSKNKGNLLLETEIAITLHEANWKQLLAPLTDGTIIGIVKKIRTLRGEPTTKQDHISDVFTNSKNIEKFISFLSGQGGVGQVAVHITNHVLAQKAGLKMKALHNYFGLGEAQPTQQTSEVELNKRKRKDIEDLFDKNLALKEIGTEKQYSEYLDSIFPDSKVKDIVYHGTKAYSPSGLEKPKFETFDKSFIGKGSGLRSDDMVKGFYFGSYSIADKAGTRVIPAILDIQEVNNTTVRRDTVDFDTKGDVFVVKEPEQIYILGSKQDVRGFKDFVSKGNKKTQQASKVETKEGQIELGGIENESGQQISEILSELLTAYVDISQDDYILDINAVQSTANTILMMLRQGMKPETIFMFINQPIIRDYVAAQALNESVITDRDNGKKSKGEMVFDAMRKYGNVPKEDAMIWWTESKIADGNTKIKRLGKIYEDFTSAGLANNIKAGNNAKNQVQVLDVFLETQRQSTIFQKMISSTSPDTKGFKGISTLENQVQEAQEVKDTEMFVNYNKMFDSFIGEYQNVKEKYYEKVKEHFISQNPLYKAELDGLKELVLSKTYGNEAKNKALALIDNEFVRFILGRGGKINFGTGFNNLFTGENSVPKTLIKLKDYFKENEIDNIFLEQILPLINNTEQGFDSLKFKGKRLTTSQKETLSVGFKALKENDAWIESEFGVKEFYKSMIAYQMIQSGIGNSPLSIMEAIPAEDYFDFMKEEITKFSNSDVGISEFTGASAEQVGEFILHHPQLFYNKYKLPFQVEWNIQREKFSIAMYGKDASQNYSLLQMGNRHYYAQYGMYPEVLSAPKAAIAKYGGLKQIADATNYKYQLSNSEVTEIRPELENTLTELLTSLGADIQYVDQITDRHGEVINAYGRADLVNQVIQLTKGRNITTLPEEAAHIITGMLGKDHPLMKQMMAKIDQFPIYESVLSEYAGVYETEEDFRFEAVGKMIATNLINGTKIKSPELESFTKNWFQRLVRKISQLFFGKDTSKLQSEMDIFAVVSEKIRTGQITQDIADATETNVDRRTRRVAKSYNMDNNGVMPDTISKEALEADLKKEKLSKLSVRKVSNGYALFQEGKKVNPIQEYLQMRETTTQDSLVKAFVRDEKRKSPGFVLDSKNDERYIVDGKMVPGRVSDATTKKFASNRSQAEVDKYNNSPESKIYSEMGTYLHELSEEFFNNAIDSDLPQYKNLARASGTKASVTNPNPMIKFADGTTKPIVQLNKRQKNVVAESIDYLAQEVNKVQESIDPNKKAIVRLENFVIDKKGEVGGSQDVTVIYSDGSVSIYDYKNLGTLQRNEQNSIENDTTVSSFKLDGYNLQISIYMKMLREEYGVTKFRSTRILPFALQYAKTREGVLLPQLANIEGFTPEGEKEYLMPIPVVKELGENKDLNKILTSLFTREGILEKDIRTNWGNVARRDILQGELKTLKKSITAIQVRGDVTPLISTVEEAIEHVSQVTKDNKFTTENIGELNKLLLEVKLFNSIFMYAKPTSEDVNLQNKYNEVNTRISQAEAVLAGKLNEALVEKFGKEINIPQKELGGLTTLFSNFSQINQPIFEAGRELVKKATGDTNRDVLAFVDKVEVEVKDLKAWTKSRGMSLLDAYDKITNQENGNLIGKLSKDFYAAKKKALSNKDYKWLQKNFKIGVEGKKLYEEDLALFKSSLKKGSKLNENRTKAWVLRNDLTGSNIAWSNKFALNRYSEIQNEEKQYSKEYKELLSPSNAGLKKYYDFYIQANRDFNEALKGHDNISPNFVANIRKDIIDSVAQGDGIYASGKNGVKDFMASLRVRQNDVQLVEGEETTIPLLYQDNFMYKNKEGEWVSDVAAKNKDLTNNLILFSEAVFRKKNMLKIADITESLKMHINEQKIIKTTGTNKVILNEDGTAKLGESNTNADLFDVLTKGLVYGKRIQNKDSEFGLFGQQMSTNKTITTLMSYMSTKSLAFNYVSGFGNAAAGMINTKIKSKSGLYYNSKQMNKSFAMITKRENRDIWNHAANFFNVEKDHWVHEKAAELSASKLTKALTFDKWYILQQKGDEMIANTILLSMMQNYGIDTNGNVKRLAQLPEGSKSILDRMDRTGDKISVEGMSNEAFDDFRNRVKYVSRQIKGTNTTEDLSKVQTDVRMKALTHFRNWIAPMVKERFGNIGYTQEVQEFEYGRFAGTFKTIMADAWKSIPKLLLDVVTLGKIKYEGNIEVLEAQYEIFKKDNPHLVGTKGMPTIEEYLEIRERALREGLYELKWVLGLMVLGLVAASDFDDDGEPDYKANAATRIAYKLMKRAHLELSFFVDPTSVKELLKSPVPVMQVLTDVWNVGGNTISETGDLIFGQEEKRDQTPIGHYSKKMVPVVKVMFDFFEDLDLDSEE